ncbi:RNA polymerase sigma factor [Geminisphaera colitermitum]|uniref:RNA polymerase sigma factor n=1 Tax=Geminisphaera colitermitum TaxID=1148786 RepID=UPI0001964F47|nr:RNA polymerase sigma factor [Geminisphaera colitermitum]
MSEPSCHGSADTIPSPETEHDATLVKRVNAGDAAAFAEIVMLHRGKLFAIAFSLLRNRADAEEIVQDTFIRAYRGLALFRGECPFAAWLRRIAVNLSRNRYWYFFCRHRHATLSFDCTLNAGNTATFADLIASDDPDPVRETMKHEFLAHVAACMKELGALQSEILTLRNRKGCSYDEIAETLGISEGTVKSRIGRAREDLLKLLARIYPEAAGGSPLFSRWFEPGRPAT